jgi:hypothetical protein
LANATQLTALGIVALIALAGVLGSNTSTPQPNNKPVYTQNHLNSQNQTFTENNKTLSYSLPYTGVGADLTLSYSSGPISDWNTRAANSPNGTMTYLMLMEWWKANVGMTDSKIMFVFPNGGNGNSVLDYTKMDTLASWFNGIGVKIVATMMQGDDNSVYQYGATTACLNSWVTFAQHYPTGTTLGNAFSAFDLFGENNWNYDSAFYASKAAFLQHWTNIVQAIHAVDYNRVCIFPFPFFIYHHGAEGGASAYLAALAATSINGHSILQEPNVVFDICHPYWFPTAYGQPKNNCGNPEDEADWYATNELAPCVAALGASRCWLGETYLWDEESSPGHLDMANHALQVRWVTAIIAKLVQYSVGFSLLNSITYYSDDYVAAINAGGYPLGDPPDPDPTPDPDPDPVPVEQVTWGTTDAAAADTNFDAYTTRIRGALLTCPSKGKVEKVTAAMRADDSVTVLAAAAIYDSAYNLLGYSTNPFISLTTSFASVDFTFVTRPDVENGEDYYVLIWVNNNTDQTVHLGTTGVNDSSDYYSDTYSNFAAFPNPISVSNTVFGTPCLLVTNAARQLVTVYSSYLTMMRNQ